MSMTLEEAIKHAEEVANDYEDMTDDYALDSEKLHKCANEHRQLAAYLRELQERRKADSCEGCVYEGCDCLSCVTCRRICKDKYKPERSHHMILLFILIIFAGFLLHDAVTIALDHVDWLMMFTERHDTEEDDK